MNAEFEKRREDVHALVDKIGEAMDGHSYEVIMPALMILYVDCAHYLGIPKGLLLEMTSGGFDAVSYDNPDKENLQ